MASSILPESRLRVPAVQQLSLKVWVGAASAALWALGLSGALWKWWADIEPSSWSWIALAAAGAPLVVVGLVAVLLDWGQYNRWTE